MNLRDDPAAKRGAALMRPIPDYGRDAPCLRDPVRPRLVWAQRSALVRKPSDLVWLVGSVILGVIFFAGFFAYLALEDRGTKRTKTQDSRD